MKNIFIILIIPFSIINCSNTTNTDMVASVDSTSIQNIDPLKKNKFLYAFYNDEAGTCGYTNEKGDTIVPSGTYQYCFTDTVRHFAAVMDKNNKCIAIDKEGKFMYEIFFYDNGPDYVSDGLFRMVKDGKIGYANEKGEIVIQPQYECTNPFEDGKAEVALKCQLIPEGEYTRMESKEWFTINKKGQKIN